MNFLSAHWRDLLLANYSVDRQVLAPFVPLGTSIDEFNGHVFVSLVAFLFDNTRIVGVPVPFHRKFEEVNLRFYVTPDKDRSIRAVTFVKEIVPKRAIPIIANALFNENYAKEPMDHGSDGQRFWYSWGRNPTNLFAAKIDADLTLPAAGSIGEFITEHYWGYTKGSSSTIEYRVAHPQWISCEISDYEISVDFAATYGERFAFLNSTQPFNVQYALGSDVTVSFPGRI